MITSLIVCRRCSVPAGSCRPPSPPNQTNAVNLRYAGMPAGPSQSLGKCRDRQVTRDDRRVHQQRNQHELQRLGRMPQQRESAGDKTAKGHRVAGSPVVPPDCRKELDDHHAGDGRRFGHAHTTQHAHEFADARGGERVGAGDETGHHHAKPHGKQPDDMYQASAPEPEADAAPEAPADVDQIGDVSLPERLWRAVPASAGLPACAVGRALSWFSGVLKAGFSVSWDGGIRCS